MDYLLDTSFLIGLWRSRGNGAEGAFLERHAEAVMALPWIAKGEFLCGAVVAGHDVDRIGAFLADFPVVWPDDPVVFCYARLFAGLQKHRRRVGPNDLWIAAAAVDRGLPLLTRNVKELRRVDGLEVIDYAA